MERLDTIQKEAKLNEVYRIGEPGPGGAHHDYEVHMTGIQPAPEWGTLMLSVHFQKGPRKEAASRNGVLDTDLLEIVRDRLSEFQAGEMANEYNAQALMHVEKALKLMNMRVEDRIKRNVLGTMEK